jgi:hypothetical protein
MLRSAVSDGCAPDPKEMCAVDEFFLVIKHFSSTLQRERRALEQAAAKQKLQTKK